MFKYDKRIKKSEIGPDVSRICRRLYCFKRQMEIEGSFETLSQLDEIKMHQNMRMRWKKLYNEN